MALTDHPTDLTGLWHALWQTTAEGRPNINTEVVRLQQRGPELWLENTGRSPENPIGGYLWRGEGVLYNGQYLIGSYAAAEQSVIAKGSLYFVLNPGGDYLVGKWVGCNLDSTFTWGFGVFAKDKERGMAKLRLLLGRQDGSVPPVLVEKAR
ncbi:MAG: hypothetical protein JO250_20740 [Armatimonadetes bacterium]|nr:hypothetical protein [Armatimonadota bacterium]